MHLVVCVFAKDHHARARKKLLTVKFQRYIDRIGDNIVFIDWNTMAKVNCVTSSYANDLFLKIKFSREKQRTLSSK